MARFGSTALAISAATLLSACGGGGGGGGNTAAAPTQPPSFSDEVDAFNDALDDARDAAFSNATSVSGAGGTYTGTSQLRIVDGSTEQFFLGDASLTVDIAAETVSGTLSDFRGGLLTADPEDLTGDIDVVGQSIGVAQDSEFVSTVSGTLTGSGTTIVLGAGTLFGDFYSNPTNSLTASGTMTNTELNGTTGLTSNLNVQATKE